MTKRGSVGVEWGVACGFFASIVSITWLSVTGNDGNLVYIADDPYIHMSMAKNFARHGIWGVTPASFSSASSSPLWTGLLAIAYLLTGVRAETALALNTAFGVCMLLLAGRIGVALGYSRTTLVAVLVALLLICTFYTFYGMETVFQFVVLAGLVHVSTASLTHPTNEVSTWRPALLAGLATAARYEDVVPVAVVCTAFLARRKWGTALAVVLGGAAPIIAYGAIGVANGWHFLPTSVLLKSGIGHWTLGDIIRGRDSRYIGLSLPTALMTITGIALLVGAVRREREWSRRTWWLVIFVCSSLVYALAARLSEQPVRRYEAHLVVLGVLAIAGQAAGVLPWVRKGRIGGRYVRAAGWAVALVGLALFVFAGRIIVNRVTVGSRNIYEQQFQMARLVKESFQGHVIALNDIGAVTFYSEPRILDLVGLATREIADLRLAGLYDTAHIRQVASRHGVDLVMVYREWYRGREALPPEWRCLLSWRILNNIACGGDEVSFMISDPEKAGATDARLREFSRELPRGVIQGPCSSAEVDTQ